MKIQIRVSKQQYNAELNQVIPFTYACMEIKKDTESHPRNNNNDAVVDIDIAVETLVPMLKKEFLKNLNTYLNANHRSSTPADYSLVGKKILENILKELDAAKTADPVLAAKFVGAQPDTWQNYGGTRTTPLTKNGLAKHFLSDELIQTIQKRPDLKTFKGVATRERFFNKTLESHVKKQDYKQVVILGSGFDIRPLKKNKDHQLKKKHASLYSQVKYWEVDKEEVLKKKELILKSKGLDKNATYLIADYTKKDFIEKLKSSGIQTNLPTLIIWEGNTMYLEKNQITDTIASIKSTFSQFTLAFDYFTQDFINNSKLKGYWKSGIDDIKQFANEHGLKIIESGNFGDLEIAYGVDPNPTEDVKQYSYCTLRS